MRRFHHVLVYMGDLHLVHPALNVSSLDAGILKIMCQVSLMMFSVGFLQPWTLFMIMYSISLVHLFSPYLCHNICTLKVEWNFTHESFPIKFPVLTSTLAGLV